MPTQSLLMHFMPAIKLSISTVAAGLQLQKNQQENLLVTP